MTQRTENEHVAAILSAVDAISDAVIAAGRTDIPMVGDHYDAILQHADALAAEARSDWVPLDDDDAMASIGGAVHTGLRKGTEAPESHDLWMAIRDSENAWPEAVEYAVMVLKDYAGIRLCQKRTGGGTTDESDDDASDGTQP